MPNSDAFCAELLSEREAPATMRIALLTKSANVKREIASSAIEKERQERIAAREGLYFAGMVRVRGEELVLLLLGWRARLLCFWS